jgi:drug/metabolite transporter (DMT)-like permease
MAVLATINGSRFFIYLAIGLVVAFVAFRSSETYKREHNVTPWHLPSLVWALIGFLSLLLCAILFLIARKTTKPAVSSVMQPQTPAPGWYPDPSAQHELRYWDGSLWTSRVEDGGVELVAES